LAKRIKKQEHERLDDATINRVIDLLNRKDPITKKAACEILNIRYNPKRLSTIIEQYEERIEYEKKARARNKGKPLTDRDYKYIILNYLKGDSMSGIADSIYRSASTIKKALQDKHIPLRDSSVDYWNPSIIPDEAIREEFHIGQLVWSARYNSVAEIINIREDTILLPQTKLVAETRTVYNIWVYGKHNEYAYQPSWELGALPVLEEFNITSKDIENTQEI